MYRFEGSLKARLFSGIAYRIHSEKDQDDIIDISVLGKEKKDAGLFSMVKSTLDTLLDPPEASFLMVIFGGHLHSVTNKHSPIVQSIKYVLENTDPEKTLIIITGECLFLVKLNLLKI